MKSTIKILIVKVLIALAATYSAGAQSNLFIKGGMDIQYNSRQTSPPAKGVKDVYTLGINVANSVQFRGKIEDTPQLIDGWISKSVVQPRKLNYDINCDVINPRNPAQVRNIGRMYGVVPISSDGAYNYDNGSLVVDILPIGNASGFTDKFKGIATGKPLVRPSNWMDTLQREAVNITRSVGGKTMTVVLKKYDKMSFSQCVLAAGPVQIYPAVTVNGEMLYDYDKSCWFFNNFIAQYAESNIVRSDRIAGTIRWVEAADRKTTGIGEYEFDIRVNEPQQSDAAAFSSSTSDESSFFQTDASMPGLSGVMKYKDTLRGDDTMASSVTINLTGNNISKQQLMVLAKVIIFSAVIPMNSD